MPGDDLLLDVPSHMLGQALPGEDKQSFVPLKGVCPRCRSTLLWADLIRFKKGHYRNAVVEMQGASALAEDVQDDDV